MAPTSTERCPGCLRRAVSPVGRAGQPRRQSVSAPSGVSLLGGGCSFRGDCLTYHFLLTAEEKCRRGGEQMQGWGGGKHPGAEEPGKGQLLSCLADRSEPIQWPEDIPSPCTSLDLSGHRTRVDVWLGSLADGRKRKVKPRPARPAGSSDPGHQRAKGQEVDSDAPTLRRCLACAAPASATAHKPDSSSPV